MSRSPAASSTKVRSARPAYADDTEQMLRAICHDFRAPVRQLDAWGAVLAEARATVATYRASERDDVAPESERLAEAEADIEMALDMIGRSAGRMFDLLAGLEQVTAARRSTPQFCSVSVDDLVGTAQHLLVQRKGLGPAAIEVVGGDLLLEVDTKLFAAALAEVFANALVFTESLSPIRLEASRADGRATVSISDDGIGMRPESTDVAVGLFTRCHGKDLSGIGAGLAVVRNVMIRHGGTVDIASEPGRGTTVRLHVPIRTDSPLVEGASHELAR